MIIVYDKRNGNLLYTIESEVKPLLRDFEGLIVTEEKVKIGDYYFDLVNEVLLPKVHIILTLENNVLKVEAPIEIKETKLTIANVESEKALNLTIENGFKEIPLKIQSGRKTEIYIFTEQHKSDTIILNDENYLEGELII